MCKLTVTWANAIDRARIETNIDVPAYVRVALPYTVPVIGHQVKMNGVMNWAIVGTDDEYWSRLKEFLRVKEDTLSCMAKLVAKMYVERYKEEDIELVLYSQLPWVTMPTNEAYDLAGWWYRQIIKSLRVAIAPVRSRPDEDFHKKVVEFSTRDGVIYLAWSCGHEQ